MICQDNSDFQQIAHLALFKPTDQNPVHKWSEANIKNATEHYYCYLGLFNVLMMSM